MALDVVATLVSILICCAEDSSSLYMNVRETEGHGNHGKGCGNIMWISYEADSKWHACIVCQKQDQWLSWCWVVWRLAVLFLCFGGVPYMQKYLEKLTQLDCSGSYS